MVKVNCSNCGKVVKRRDTEINRSKTGRFFCNKSCSASYNNSKFPKREPTKVPNSCVCVGCGCKIDLSDKSYEVKYCSRECQSNTKATEFGDRWVRDGPKALPKSMGLTGLLRGWARKYLFLHYNNKCSRCGWTHDFNDGSLPPLHAAHKDGDSTNNNFDNFELLCPNCHAIDTRLSQTPAGSGRFRYAKYVGVKPTT